MANARNPHRDGGPSAAPAGRFARARAYLTRRVDPLTSLFLVVPLFVVYQIGVLLQMDCGPQVGCRWEGNGVDFLTGNLMAATHGSRLAYAGLTLGVAVALLVGALWARRRAKLHPRLFVPVLLESALYASLVGPLVAAVQGRLGMMGAREGRSLFGDLVSSFGAGLHEELIFRAVLFAGGAFALKKLGARPTAAVLTSAVASSALFSLAHHLGALGDPFTVRAFVFRFFAGLIFAAVYRARGFAIAAWTHALYDVWVTTLMHFA